MVDGLFDLLRSAIDADAQMTADEELGTQVIEEVAPTP